MLLPNLSRCSWLKLCGSSSLCGSSFCSRPCMWLTCVTACMFIINVAWSLSHFLLVQITNKCLPSILKLQYLENLVLEGCFGIDDDSLAVLKQGCKSLEVPINGEIIELTVWFMKYTFWYLLKDNFMICAVVISAIAIEFTFVQSSCLSYDH